MNSLKEMPSLKNEERTPIILDVEEWAEEIRSMVNTNISMPKRAEGMLFRYNKSLMEQLKVCRDRPFLQREIAKHVKFFYVYYFESSTNINDYLYELMEFVLTVHCTIEIEATQRKIDTVSIENGFCTEPLERRLLTVLLAFYEKRKHHILHILLRVKYNIKSPSNRRVMSYILGKVLLEFPLNVFNDEVFCAAYILHYKLLELLTSTPENRKHAMNCFQVRFKEHLKRMEETEIGKTILKMRQRDRNQSITDIFCSKSNATLKYFNYIKNRKQDNNRKDIQDEQKKTEAPVLIDLDKIEEDMEVIEILSDDPEEDDKLKSRKFKPIKKKKTKKISLQKNSIIELSDDSSDEFVHDMMVKDKNKGDENDINAMGKDVFKSATSPDKNQTVLSENKNVINLVPENIIECKKEPSVKYAEEKCLQAKPIDSDLTSESVQNVTPVIDDVIVSIEDNTVITENSVPAETDLIQTDAVELPQVNNSVSVVNEQISKSSIVDNVQENNITNEPVVNLETSDSLKDTDVVDNCIDVPPKSPLDSQITKLKGEKRKETHSAPESLQSKRPNLETSDNNETTQTVSVKRKFNEIDSDGEETNVGKRKSDHIQTTQSPATSPQLENNHVILQTPPTSPIHPQVPEGQASTKHVDANEEDCGYDTGQTPSPSEEKFDGYHDETDRVKGDKVQDDAREHSDTECDISEPVIQFQQNIVLEKCVEEPVLEDRQETIKELILPVVSSTNDTSQLILPNNERNGVEYSKQPEVTSTTTNQVPSVDQMNKQFEEEMEKAMVSDVDGVIVKTVVSDSDVFLMPHIPELDITYFDAQYNYLMKSPPRTQVMPAIHKAPATTQATTQVRAATQARATSKAKKTQQHGNMNGLSTNNKTSRKAANGKRKNQSIPVNNAFDDNKPAVMLPAPVPLLTNDIESKKPDQRKFAGMFNNEENSAGIYQTRSLQNGSRYSRNNDSVPRGRGRGRPRTGKGSRKGNNW